MIPGSLAEAPRAWTSSIYALELHPLEGSRAYLKGGSLANLCAKYMAEVEIRAEKGVDAVRKNRGLPLAFLRHAGLSL